MYEVIPHLYLGNRMDGGSFERLLQNNIHRILQIEKEEPTFESMFIERHIIDIPDSPLETILPLFPFTCQWIDDSITKGESILVHCKAGISRAPTFVIAYLIWKLKVSYDLARNLLLQKCPFIDPNWGFIHQLHQWEQNCLY